MRTQSWLVSLARTLLLPECAWSAPRWTAAKRPASPRF